MTHKPKVLIVDDDKDILEFLSYNLENAGFDTVSINDPLEVIEQAKAFKPDIIILDVMMPHIDGIEVCENIRHTPEIADTLITFLTARSEDYSQIAGYQAGADDYIAKPIKPKVFISKIKALLKRKSYNTPAETKSEGTGKKLGSIVIDKESYIVTKDEVDFVLPKKEFELLHLLASQPNKVFHRDEIYTNVWGDDSFVGDRTIDVHIRKLRKKFGDDIIKTVKGVGYKFTE